MKQTKHYSAGRAITAYLEKAFAAFLSSFRFKSSFVFVLCYELVFFLAIAGLFAAFSNWLAAIAAKFQSINPYVVSAETAAAIKSFFVQSILALIAVLAIVLVVYAVVQFLAWLAITNKKFTAGLLLRFFLLNFVWLLPWLVLWWFFLTGLKGTYAAVGIALLAIIFVHLTLILQHAFVNETKPAIKKAVSKAFATGLGKLHKFIIPYALAALVFVAWSQLWRLIPALTNSAFALAVLACAIFAPFLAWVKFYVKNVVEKVV